MQKTPQNLSNAGYFNLFLRETEKFLRCRNFKFTDNTMNKYFLIILVLIASAANVFAEETFVFKNESKIYDVKVRVESCEKEGGERLICNSKGVFYLLKKGQPQILQTIEMEETYLVIADKKQKKGDVTELYGSEHVGVYFADYDFDGLEDLGVGNGSYRPYGGISFDVFLYSKTGGKFVRHAGLSHLETEMVSVDLNKKLKIIETNTKSGCCWHEKARYRFTGRRLQKFYVLTEDAMNTDGEWMEVTTERLVKGQWRRTTKKVLTKDYYKD